MIFLLGGTKSLSQSLVAGDHLHWLAWGSWVDHVCYHLQGHVSAAFFAMVSCFLDVLGEASPVALAILGSLVHLVHILVAHV